MAKKEKKEKEIEINEKLNKEMDEPNIEVDDKFDEEDENIDDNIDNYDESDLVNIEDGLIEQIKSEINEIYQALANDPNNSEYHILLAHALFLLDDWEAAISHAKTAIVCSNNDPGILKEVATLYMLNGDTAIALEHINKAIEVCPSALEYYYNRVTLNYIARKYDECLDDCDFVISRGFNDNGVAYYIRGLVKLFLNKEEMALKDFSYAAKNAKDKGMKLLCKFISEILSGKNKVALKTIDKYLDHVENDYDIIAILFKGINHYLLGEIDLAIDDISFVLKEGEENNSLACFYLAKAYSVRGNAKKAQEFFNRAAELGYLPAINR